MDTTFNLTCVIKYANFLNMDYLVKYYHISIIAEIESWPDSILADFARLLELLMEFGPNLRMPYSRALGDGLFEMRPHGRDGIARIFFCYTAGQTIVLLHAYLKKTQTAPGRELNTARKRMKEARGCQR